jgi:micrococcal nuclease
MIWGMTFKSRGNNKRAKLIFLLIAILFLPSCNPSRPPGVTVTKVIDGDTIKVIYKGRKESVRILGIDTPEAVLNPKAERDAERTGRDLKTIISITRSIVKRGKAVKLEFDVQLRDKYGRLLAYVWLPDGRMLNEIIVAEGYINTIYDLYKRC